MKERLQKVLSNHGFGSRRRCEILIREGRVSINNKIAELGAKADPFVDQIKVDNRLLQPINKKDIYLILYKPRDVLSDIVRKDKRPIVRDYIPLKDHLFIVGRLDKDSEGLILLTNDGEAANILTHPRYEHEKEYLVLLHKIPDEKQIAAWRHGVVLKNKQRMLPADVEIVNQVKDGCWINLVMREGKKREIREIGSTIGLHVKRIIRKRIADIQLGELKPGEWRYLNKSEIQSIKSKLTLASK